MTISRFKLFECIASFDRQFLQNDGSTAYRLQASPNGVRSSISGGAGLVLSDRAGCADFGLPSDQNAQFIHACQQYPNFAFVRYQDGFAVRLVVSDNWWMVFKPQLDQALLTSGTALYVSVFAAPESQLTNIDVQDGKPVLMPHPQIQLLPSHAAKEFEQ